MNFESTRLEFVIKESSLGWTKHLSISKLNVSKWQAQWSEIICTFDCTRSQLYRLIVISDSDRSLISRALKYLLLQVTGIHQIRFVGASQFNLIRKKQDAHSQRGIRPRQSTNHTHTYAYTYTDTHYWFFEPLDPSAVCQMDERTFLSPHNLLYQIEFSQTVVSPSSPPSSLLCRVTLVLMLAPDDTITCDSGIFFIGPYFHVNDNPGQSISME